MTVDVLVVGGGLTGISAALHLRRPFVLVEREPELGGLARTVHREGFSFDATGHWLHLRDPAMMALARGVMGDDLASVKRHARVYTGGALTLYPFQANLHGLPPKVAYECLLGFVRSQLDKCRQGQDEPRNFEQYILHHFGDGIARHFMIPYNTKLWGVHPREITSAWCKRLVPIPTLEQVVAGSVGAPSSELGYNVSFLYPRLGGIGAFSAALAGQLDPGAIRLGAELESVDPVRRVAVVGGEPVHYRALVSTIPLPELVRRLVDPPAEVLAAAQRLRWTAVRYLNVACRTAPPEPYHWVYVPEHRLPFYRVGVFSSAVPSMAPPGASSLYVELASRDRSRGEAETVAEVIPALVEVRALRSPADVVFAELHEIEYAYVVFDESYEQALGEILPYLENHRIFSRGRYGSWVYNAMEDSLIAGKEVAVEIDRLLSASSGSSGAE